MVLHSEVEREYKRVFKVTYDEDAERDYRRAGERYVEIWDKLKLQLDQRAK